MQLLQGRRTPLLGYHALILCLYFILYLKTKVVRINKMFSVWVPPFYNMFVFDSLSVHTSLWSIMVVASFLIFLEAFVKSGSRDIYGFCSTFQRPP